MNVHVRALSARAVTSVATACRQLYPQTVLGVWCKVDGLSRLFLEMTSELLSTVCMGQLEEGRVLLSDQ
jgi:hypothetical protein